MNLQFALSAVLAVSQIDLAVWLASALLALGIGWSRYAKWTTREKLVRELIAMEPEARTKFLMRLDPKLAMEMRQELLKRFNILA